MQTISIKLYCDIFTADLDAIEKDIEEYIKAYSSIDYEFIMQTVQFVLDQKYTLEISTKILTIIIKAFESLKDTNISDLILFNNVATKTYLDLTHHINLETVESNLQQLISLNLPIELTQVKFYELLHFMFTKQQLYVEHRESILAIIAMLKSIKK